MSIPQAKFREIVFQLLYSHDISGGDPDLMVPLLMKQLAVTRKAVKQARERCDAIEAVLDTVDQRIRSACHAYEFTRIQVVERNILRLAAYELVVDDEIPPKVAISEAIRLARKFGTPEAAAFINAVLESIWRAEEGDATTGGEIETAAAAKEASEEAASEAAAASDAEVEADDGAEGEAS